VAVEKTLKVFNDLDVFCLQPAGRGGLITLSALYTWRISWNGTDCRKSGASSGSGTVKNKEKVWEGVKEMSRTKMERRRQLARLPFEEKIPINPDYRNSFLEEYVGPVDDNSSGRFLYVIKHLVQNGNITALKMSSK